MKVDELNEKYRGRLKDVLSSIERIKMDMFTDRQSGELMNIHSSTLQSTALEIITGCILQETALMYDIATGEHFKRKGNKYTMYQRIRKALGYIFP